MKRTFKDCLLIAAKGVAMGAADVVPGVSGGTVALISGIYDELINTLKNVPNAVKCLFKSRFNLPLFWKELNGTFLTALLSGIALSFISLAKLITYLLENQPVLVWSFFTGLILASTVFIARDVKWNLKAAVAFVLFAAVSFFITSPENSPLQSAPAPWYIFLCGAIAICAMILPGISGSFILVLLGQYFFMMTAIHELHFIILLIFLCGAIIGLLLFSNILSWLLKRYKNMTLVSLTGFMLGSLNKIWPWKRTLETFTDSHGIVKPLVEENVLPGHYYGNPQLFRAILVACAGFALIFVIERISLHIRKSHAK
ncbi:MAG: DUF368 domain-containing protein [Bacteroidales bacterium]|jgi:putative membrane protein|nr:DUF368 domain-containing protein [Bacteroidales bacterium]